VYCLFQVWENDLRCYIDIILKDGLDYVLTWPACPVPCPHRKILLTGISFEVSRLWGGQVIETFKLRHLRNERLSPSGSLLCEVIGGGSDCGCWFVPEGRRRVLFCEVTDGGSDCECWFVLKRHRCVGCPFLLQFRHGGAFGHSNFVWPFFLQ